MQLTDLLGGSNESELATVTQTAISNLFKACVTVSDLTSEFKTPFEKLPKDVQFAVTGQLLTANLACKTLNDLNLGETRAIFTKSIFVGFSPYLDAYLDSQNKLVEESKAIAASLKRVNERYGNPRRG